MQPSYWPLTGIELSDRDLLTIARLVYEKTGIHLHEGKRALVAARLQKRPVVIGNRAARTLGSRPPTNARPSAYSRPATRICGVTVNANVI